MLMHDGLGDTAYSVAIADVNGDGNQDVLVTSGFENSSYLATLLGNGDGTFQPSRNLFFASRTTPDHTPGMMIIQDVNHDSKLDVVAAVPGLTDVDRGFLVMLGKGDGTFMLPMDTRTIDPFPAFAIADMNEDGRPDLAYLRSDGLGFYLGRGDGAFQRSDEAFGFGHYRFGIATADVNLDGHADMVVTEQNIYNHNGVDQNYVIVLLGDGKAGVSLAKESDLPGVPNQGVAVADVSGDGVPDVAVTTGAGTCVLLGNADGSFQPAKIFGDAPGTPIRVAIADLDLDGKQDLIVLHPDPYDIVEVLWGSGDGTFPLSKSYGVDLHPVDMAVGDVNGDGRPDVVVANMGGSLKMLLTISR